jgi:transketolase
LRTGGCVLLLGDVGFGLFDDVLADERVVNCGSAEQAMACIATGLALAGELPVIYGIASFVVTRAAEPIKTGLSYHGAHALLIGVGAGFAYGSLGPTHHCLEDVSILKGLPNVKILTPGTPIDLEYLLEMSFAEPAVYYLRVPNDQSALVESFGDGFLRPAGRLPTRGSVAVVSYGATLGECWEAMQEFPDVDLFSLLVLDESQARHPLLAGYRTVLFVEEAYRRGSFGETFAAALPRGVSCRHVGVESAYPHRHGSWSYYARWAGIDRTRIRNLLSECTESVPRPEVFSRGDDDSRSV